jgi:hypothetical protein
MISVTTRCHERAMMLKMPNVPARAWTLENARSSDASRLQSDTLPIDASLWQNDTQLYRASHIKRATRMVTRATPTTRPTIDARSRMVNDTLLKCASPNCNDARR